MTVAAQPRLRPAEVAGAVDAARRAQAAWRAALPGGRRPALGRLQALVLAAADEIADIVVAETAKPRVEAITSELYPALDALAWLARNADRTLRPERLRFAQPHLLHKRGETHFEPYGVVGLITPWNFPFAIPFTQTVYALAAGNAVVLKPSELTPASGALVGRLVRDAGLPDGLVQVVPGDGDVGAALVEAGIDKVVFTGSVETGRRVAAAAGERLVPATLELGGKDAMIVLDDADLSRAGDGALWASFFNCGQVCSGVERVYVERAVHEAFVEELARKARALRPGVDVGPLISEGQRARVAALVDDAVAGGAQAVAGGEPGDGPGWSYRPTVLTHVPAGARIEREEIFGPVVTVAPVRDEREAIAAANDTGFGLGASVWTRDAQRARRVATRLRAGTVWHNDHAYSYAASQATWGGAGQSGYGRTHGRHGLLDLVRPKTVDRDGGRVPVPWWFPYDDAAAAAFRGSLAALYGGGAAARARGAWQGRRALTELARRYRR